MAKYEYRVVPAPNKAVKKSGVKGAEARFALAIETLMNELAVEGWEYVRSDTLPSEERVGFTSKTTVFRNMLVFRRLRATLAQAPKAAPRELPPAAEERRGLPAPEPKADMPAAANSQTRPRRVSETVSMSDGALEPHPRDRTERPRINAALAARAARLKANQTAAE